MKITCVIPAYNEAVHIAAAVEAVKPYVDEVVVVDDCSKDNTLALAKEAGALVLRHAINRGQGAALQTGNDYALFRGADIIVHFDADNQFAASEIKDLTAPLLSGECDAVFGSRFLGKKSNMPSGKKYLIMPLARFINRVVFNIRLTDPQSGFRALTAAAASEIRIDNDGMAHCNEILIKTFARALRVKEVPITVTYEEFGQRWGGGVRILKDLFLKNLIK
jgi:glycosyltransferase involved in cell wall biosynthesis